jgi:hypothetical protein
MALDCIAERRAGATRPDEKILFRPLGRSFDPTCQKDGVARF